MNKRAVGSVHEARAASYLEQHGCRILAINYRCRTGEIDLIVRQETYLVFVEVKYRADFRAGYGMEAVDRKKQKRIIQAARWYLKENHLSFDQPCRFDVISFLGEEVTWIQNAYEC